MEEKSLILSRKNLSTVSFAVGVKFGAINEEIGGATEIMASHMFRNTAEKDEKELALFLDKHGIVTFDQVSKTNMWFGMNTPPQNLHIALNTMKEILFNSDFKEDTTMKLVQQQKGTLAQLDQMPQQRLFQRTRWESAFGQSLISKSSLGTTESLDTISVEGLHNNYEDMLQHQHEFVAVGNGVDKSQFEEFTTLLDKFGDKKFDGNLIADPVSELNSQVDKMTATTQNAYLAVNMKIHGSKESKMEDVIFQNILAGGFSSRFFREIRDERNLSYATFVLNNKLDGFGLFSGCMDVRPDRAEEGRDVTLRIMKDVLNEKIGDDEMNRALKAAQKTALFVSDSSQSYTNWLIGRRLNGLETDLDKVNETIIEASQMDWQETMQKFWRRENITLGIAGEPGEAENTWKQAVEMIL